MLLKTSLRSFLAHKGRMALSLIAVVLSVAFVSGTLVFSNTATSTFDKLFAATASDVSVQPPKPADDEDPQFADKPATVPAALAGQVAAVPGIKTAVGQVMVHNATLVNPATNKLVGPTSGAPTLVGNWTDTPRNPVTITSGHAPQGAGELVLDADTAKKAKLGLGDKLRVDNAGGKHEFTIAGIATFTTTNPGAALAFLDTATSQQVLLGEPAFTSIEAFGDGSRSDDSLKADALAKVGGGYQVKTAAEQKDENNKSVGSGLEFMKYAMLGFAGVSLIVGGFLIINTFSMLVAQRTREIGLLRAIGGSRRQVNRSVLVEALILGVLGSTLGIAAGLGIAVGLIALMNAIGMDLRASDLQIGPDVFVTGYAVGILITVVAAWIPARRASRIAPMAALRDHGTPAEARANVVRTVLGLVLTAGGGGLLVLAAKAEKAATGGQYLGLGVLLTLIGFVVLGPLLATAVIRVLGALLPALFGPSGKLAQRNAMRNPRRTGATAAALMIGLALVIASSVFSSSAVTSASEQIDRSVGVDYIISGGRTAVTAEMLDAVRRTPGVDHVTAERDFDAKVQLSDGRTGRTGLAAVPPTFFGTDFRLPVASGAVDSIGSGSLGIGENFAKDHNLKVGDSVTVTYLKGRTQVLQVGVVFAKSSLYADASFVDVATMAKAVPAAEVPEPRTFFAKASSGADAGKTLTALEDALKEYPQLSVKDQAGYKELVQSQVNTLLYLIYGLVGLSITVAVLGVVNTLALSVVERTREIGLLRAIGLSRRQLRRMIRLESVVIAVFGAVLGTGLGLAWGVTAQRVLRDQGLGTLSVPTTTIAITLVSSVAIGLVAALVPAFRAGRMNVLAAIATD
ncbi:ABC transporter permease [Streptomyces sp. 1331.2]|uniref:ABC transporter permease n=1 Tax=Streptomyces sp. 1331.2 TaxID=1938835 RepID=UPI000BD8B73B|nr:FtsX-like permease family protein [Streptomyces sp. 1331.2]SOB83815.1 putative ABC transport system permease protein [Streptomyces sp. 1331.2]